MAAKSRVIIPARWGTITYGFLCLLDDGYQLNPEDLSAAEAAMPEVARLLLRQHRDQQRGADRLLALLSPVASEREEAAAEFRAMKGKLSSRIAVLRFPSEVDELSVERSVDEVIRRSTARSRPVVRFVEAGRAVFLIMGTSDEQARSLMTEVAEHCAELSDLKHPVVAGIGDETADFDKAIASRDQAELAARAATGLAGEMSQVTEWSKLGALRVLVSLAPGRLSGSLDPRFDALLRTKDASLLPTLEVYLDNACHVQVTAEKLGIHRGTLYYRLRKAQEESGFDLSNGLDVLALHLALKSVALLADRGDCS